MKKKLLVALVAGIFLLGMAEGASALVWNGHTYEIIDYSNWADAEAEAVSNGGHLVTINDEAEQNWLTAAFDSNFRYWIGLTDAAIEGTWKWVSGEAVTYDNWAPGEPNNYGGEDYVAMNWDYNGKWNDWSGSISSKAIAEYTNAPVPEPATMILFGTGLVGVMGFRMRKKK